MDTLEFQRRPIKQSCPVRLGVPDGCLQLGWEWAAWSGGRGEVGALDTLPSWVDEVKK